MHEDCRRSSFNCDRVVHIVDPDASTCEALSTVFRLEGYRTLFSLDAHGLFASLERRRPDVVVASLRLGQDDGLAVVRRVKAMRRGISVVVLEDRPQIEYAVAAMKAGAADVLAKPIDTDRLVRAVRDTLHEANRRDAALGRRHAAEDRGFAHLTPRERDVLRLIAGGASNKEAGRELSISPRTVEVHRARVMEKLGARNAADLTRIVLTGEGSERRG